MLLEIVLEVASDLPFGPFLRPTVAELTVLRHHVLVKQFKGFIGAWTGDLSDPLLRQVGHSTRKADGLVARSVFDLIVADSWYDEGLFPKSRDSFDALGQAKTTYLPRPMPMPFFFCSNSLKAW